MSDKYKQFLKASAARRKWIRREYARLKNMAAVAQLFSISRERVRQIVKDQQ